MFPMSRADGVRVQVVVAHPDDETFGCGSILLHAHAAGAVTAVCCATRGEAGEAADGVAVPDGGLGALREAELREAGDLLGVSRIDVLGLLDSGMDGPALPGSLCDSDLETVRSAVDGAIRDFRPDVLVTLDGGDGHRDHLRMRDVTLELGAAHDLPVYLHCLPRSVMGRWAAHMAEVHPDSGYLALGELGTPDELVTAVLDTTEHLEQRWRAIRTHRSQTSPFERLPADLSRAFLTRDHLIATPSIELLWRP